MVSKNIGIDARQILVGDKILSNRQHHQASACCLLLLLLILIIYTDRLKLGKLHFDL